MTLRLISFCSSCWEKVSPGSFQTQNTITAELLWCETQVVIKYRKAITSSREQLGFSPKLIKDVHLLSPDGFLSSQTGGRHSHRWFTSFHPGCASTVVQILAKRLTSFFHSKCELSKAEGVYSPIGGWNRTWLKLGFNLSCVLLRNDHRGFLITSITHFVGVIIYLSIFKLHFVMFCILWMNCFCVRL